MKQRPILMSAPMVRAILAGTKTQTRRAVKRSNSLVDGWPATKLIWDQLSFDGAWVDQGPSPAGNPGPYLKTPSAVEQQVHRVYFRYQTIEQLWVREAWHTDTSDLTYARAQHEDVMSSSPICYRADPAHHNAGRTWRPSIHMPRWASRITLEVTDVRVERLQDISEGDALAEGAPPSHHSIDVISRQYGHEDFSRSWYAQLWDQINGAGSWDANPWVWVVCFRRVT